MEIPNLILRILILYVLINIFTELEKANAAELTDEQLLSTPTYLLDREAQRRQNELRLNRPNTTTVREVQVKRRTIPVKPLWVRKANRTPDSEILQRALLWNNQYYQSQEHRELADHLKHLQNQPNQESSHTGTIGVGISSQ